MNPTGYITGDFETRSLCNLKECGASRYAEDVSTEPICFSYDIQPWKVRGTWYPGDPFPTILKKALDAGFWFCAHNVSFEKSIWRYIMVPDYGWPPIPADQWHDTGALMSMRAMPFALEKALQSLDLAEEKDMEGNKLTLSMSKLDKKGYLPVITPSIRQRIGQYCEVDISGQVALLNRMGWLPPQERAIWLRSQLANERGIALDLAFVDACLEIVDKATVPLAAEFKKLTGGLAFTQMDKIKKWCASRGVLLPDMTAETLAKVLGIQEDDEEDVAPLEISIPDDVRRALHIRQLIGSAAIKKLSRMKQCVNSDGAARYLLQYHGTSPGRQTSRLFQAHNFPRGTIFLKGADGAQVKPKADGLVAAIMTRDPEYVEMLYGPAVETVVSSLRHAIIARPGRKFVSGDYAGIQARVVLGLAGQHDKTALMAAGADVYCDMASQIYGRTIVKKNQEERQVGKNCFAADTPVLTYAGWKPIVHVTLEDRLWDGVEWVKHDGLVSRGSRQTVSILGISATPEHPVLCGGQWHPWEALEHDVKMRSQALATAMVSLQFLDTPTASVAGCEGLLFNAPVSAPHIVRLKAICALAAARAATNVQNDLQPTGERNSTDTLTSYLMKVIEFGCSTASPLSFRGVKTQRTRNTSITELEAYELRQTGWEIGSLFWRIWSRYRGGIILGSTSTELTTSADTNRETCASSATKKTPETSAKFGNSNSASSNLKPVFDLVNAGSRHRFMIMTKAGPLIVHNSVLGLGFGMGKDKFHNKYCADKPLEFAEHVVKTYREQWAPLVPDLWHGLENAALDAVLHGGEHEAFGIVYHCVDRWLCAELPGGNTLWYCDPKASKREMPWSTEEQPDWRWGWSYIKSSSSGKRWRNYAFGGLLTENAVMGIERQIIEDAKERCEAEGYPVVLDVHDEILTEPTTEHGDEKELQAILEDVKPWTKALQVPIAVDCWEGPRYRK